MVERSSATRSSRTCIKDWKMKKPSSAKQLAIDILARSTCLVQVGAAIADARGIFSWGWNSAGPDGFGLHAEGHAIFRANRRRLRGATICVASRWRSSGKLTPAKPCADCERLIRKWNLKVYYRDRSGQWTVS